MKTRPPQREKPRISGASGPSSGGGEIRTLGTGVTRTTVFETAPFNHSGTPPTSTRDGRRARVAPPLAQRFSVRAKRWVAPPPLLKVTRAVTFALARRRISAFPRRLSVTFTLAVFPAFTVKRADP